MDNKKEATKWGIICKCGDADENYGCTDCQNTGWWHLKTPEPQAIADLKKRLDLKTARVQGMRTGWAKTELKLLIATKALEFYENVNFLRLSVRDIHDPKNTGFYSDEYHKDDGRRARQALKDIKGGKE